MNRGVAILVCVIALAGLAVGCGRPSRRAGKSSVAYRLTFHGVTVRVRSSPNRTEAWLGRQGIINACSFTQVVDHDRTDISMFTSDLGVVLSKDPGEFLSVEPYVQGDFKYKHPSVSTIHGKTVLSFPGEDKGEWVFLHKVQTRHGPFAISCTGTSKTVPRVLVEAVDSFRIIE